MKNTETNRGQRIARNTLMLYVRMLFMLFLGLFTSRIVLSALGESDYGIYNVVGGVVAMFTIISGALNSAVSRFITFEMGKAEGGQLGKVYSTAVTIQIILALIVVVLAEPFGLWFIDNKMTIDPVRIPAARTVLHFSLLSFVFNLMSVPQMASITAHEKMSAYAYIGIMDGCLRFAVALAISNSGSDRLVEYAFLMLLSVLAVRVAYLIYCRRHFPECRYVPVFDRPLMKEMFSFAGWNFIGVTAGVLRDHGGNILINIFSGPSVNAARAVAVQLNGVVQGFVTNFMTAVNPQITKSYASGEHDYLQSLVMKSSRLSYYLLVVLVIPVIFNAEFLLELWLEDVPERSVVFVVLFLILSLSECISNPLMTAAQATGRIREYQIVVGGLIMFNLPVSYLLMKAGAPPEITVAVAIGISQICLMARLVMLRKLIGFPVRRYLSKVYANILAVTFVSVIPLLVVRELMPDSAAWSVMNIAVCFAVAFLSVLLVGCRKEERYMIFGYIKKTLHIQC